MIHLYSDDTCPFSQRCRHILFEKGMDFEIFDVDLFNKPDDIAVMNPHGEVPILSERGLVLYESAIIMEYVDARFPHPQLMPADPMQCARARLLLFNLERELFTYVSALESDRRGQKATVSSVQARKMILERLIQIAPLFLKSKYMLGDALTIVDIALAPLLWRLERYEVELPRVAAPLRIYAERIFSRPAFIDALTPAEKAMRR